MAAGETLTRPAWQERGVVAPIAVHCEEGTLPRIQARCQLPSAWRSRA